MLSGSGGWTLIYACGACACPLLTAPLPTAVHVPFEPLLALLLPFIDALVAVDALGAKSSLAVPWPIEWL